MHYNRDSKQNRKFNFVQTLSFLTVLLHCLFCSLPVLPQYSKILFQNYPKVNRHKPQRRATERRIGRYTVKEYQIIMFWGSSVIEGKVFSDRDKALTECARLNQLADENSFPFQYAVYEI